MKDKRVPLFCSKCNKLLAKIEKNGSCKGIYLYCKKNKLSLENRKLKLYNRIFL